MTPLASATANDAASRRRLGYASGIAATLVAFAAILAATTLDPGFGWLDSALSHTGELPANRSLTADFLRSNPQFVAFNGGLILSGLLGLPFAAVLYHDAENRIQRAAAATYALAVLLLAGVGVFHLPRTLHAPVAIGHYLATTAFFAVEGAGAIRAGARRFGAITAALAPVHLAGWVVWAVALADGPVPGLAVPETYGALLFGGWTVAVAAARLREERVA